MTHPAHSNQKQGTPAGVLQSVAAITSLRDRDLLARAMVTTLDELIDSSRIAMYLIVQTETDKESVLLAGTGGRAGEVAQETGTLVSCSEEFGSVCESGKESIEPLGGNIFRSVYPITGKRGIVGLLEIISSPLSEADHRLTSAFLKVYSNYLSILDESETDTLTGLLNRRTFDNNLEAIIAESTQPDDTPTLPGSDHAARRMSGSGMPHWLAVMDIDHFKRINDKFGHLYGDEVLLLLSRNMQRIFRQRDKLFRFGGEEFVVVLDRTSLESARGVLERFRKAIEEYEFPQVGKVTISIGFVRLDKADVPSSIIGRADQALYYAKEHGRNQVCFYEELIAEGKLESEHFSNDMQLF